MTLHVYCYDSEKKLIIDNNIGTRSSVMARILVCDAASSELQVRDKISFERLGSRHLDNICSCKKNLYRCSCHRKHNCCSVYKRGYCSTLNMLSETVNNEEMFMVQVLVILIARVGTDHPACFLLSFNKPNINSYNSRPSLPCLTRYCALITASIRGTFSNMYSRSFPEIGNSRNWF